MVSRFLRGNAARRYHVPVQLELAKSIDWSRADTHDLSDDALRLAIAGTLANAPGAADVLARRFGRRCVRKIMEAVFGKYPEIPEGEVEEIVEDKAADVVMQVQAGKLTEFTTSPSDYLFIAVDNEIKDRAKKKERHEVALTRLREQQKLESGEGLQRVESTDAFLMTVAPPQARPHRIAMQREMIRALAAQVGRLPRALRQVAARTRQGMENRQIAEQLGIKESTVRSHYQDAEDMLKSWLDSNGAVAAWYLQRMPPLFTENHRGVQLNLVTTFLTSLSQECWRAFFEVHINGKRMSEARKIVGECRAGLEALLAYAYWAMWRKGGFLFPRDFIRTVLPPHPSYPDHVGRFTYW
jgi:RNA polymerase sigma factor (sigma-70 family)